MNAGFYVVTSGAMIWFLAYLAYQLWGELMCAFIVVCLLFLAFQTIAICAQLVDRES